MHMVIYLVTVILTLKQMKNKNSLFAQNHHWEASKLQDLCHTKPCLVHPNCRQICRWGGCLQLSQLVMWIQVFRLI